MTLRCLAFTLVLPMLSILAQPAPAAEDSGDPEAAARSRALELAGAFSNDGYKIRDGYWMTKLEPGKPRVIEVNLFSGNEYWFCAAALAPARKVAVTVCDETGRKIEQNSHEDGAVAAAGAEPGYSGRFYVRLDLLEGEKADACLVYCYK
jgi:hypothetical protein